MLVPGVVFTTLGCPEAQPSLLFMTYVSTLALREEQQLFLLDPTAVANGPLLIPYLIAPLLMPRNCFSPHATEVRPNVGQLLIVRELSIVIPILELLTFRPYVVVIILPVIG